MCLKLSVFLTVDHSNGGCERVCVFVAVNMFLVL